MSPVVNPHLLPAKTAPAGGFRTRCVSFLGDPSRPSAQGSAELFLWLPSYGGCDELVEGGRRKATKKKNGTKRFVTGTADGE